MAAYRLLSKSSFVKNFRKIDRKQQLRIKNWINKNLKNTDNPRHTGKALAGDLKDLWRYRVGKYRIIAQIFDTELILLFIDVAKREDIYRQS